MTGVVLIIAYNIGIWLMTEVLGRWEGFVQRQSVIGKRVFFSVMLFAVTFEMLGMDLRILLLLNLLLYMAYMDYGRGEVYVLMTLTYGGLSMLLGISCLLRGQASIAVGVLCFLPCILRVYAVADGVVMYGVLQILAFMTEGYVEAFAVFFLGVNALTSIGYVVCCCTFKIRGGRQRAYIPLIFYSAVGCIVMVMFFWVCGKVVI